MPSLCMSSPVASLPASVMLNVTGGIGEVGPPCCQIQAQFSFKS